jgi:hypothetical protein
MRRLFLLGILLTYLSSQLHEASHWVAACFLGVNNSINIVGLNIPEDTRAWQFIIIAGMGPIITIAFILLGIRFGQGRSLFIKKLSTMFVIIIAVGRLLYDISGYFLQGTDETGIAMRLGLPDYLIRMPITIICLSLLLYLLIKNRSIWNNSNTIYSVAIMVITMISSLLLNSIIQYQQTQGNLLFMPILSGYLPILAIVNPFVLLITVIMIYKNNQVYEKSHFT